MPNGLQCGCGVQSDSRYEHVTRSPPGKASQSMQASEQHLPCVNAHHPFQPQSSTGALFSTHPCVLQSVLKCNSTIRGHHLAGCLWEAWSYYGQDAEVSDVHVGWNYQTVSSSAACCDNCARAQFDNGSIGSCNLWVWCAPEFAKFK